MNEIALDIQQRLAELHKSSSGLHVDVVDRSPHGALCNDSEGGFVAIVSSHLIQSIAGWFRSSHDQK